MRACLLLIALTTPAFAGAGDLEAARAAIARLEPRSPVAGRLQEIYKRQTGAAAQPAGGSTLALEVKSEPASLSLTWSGDLLRQADAEERSRDKGAESGMPMREAMKELDPGRVAHLLDQRASLLGMLADGKLLKSEGGTFEGHPARRLELEIPVRVGDDLLRPRVAKREGRLVLWLGPDAVPLASEIHTSYEGRMSRLFGRFEDETTIRTRYGVSGDRIYVAHRDTAESFQDASGRRLTFVTLDFQQR